jgi:hypothetical protein
VPTVALYTSTTGEEYIPWPADLPPAPSNDVLGGRHAISYKGETLYDRRLVEYARAGGDLSKPIRFDLKSKSFIWRPGPAGARGSWYEGAFPKTWAWQEIVEAYRTAGQLTRAFPDDGSEWATEQILAKTYAAYKEAQKSGIQSRINETFAAYAKTYEEYFKETPLRDVLMSLYRDGSPSAIAEMELLWPGWHAWRVAYDKWLEDLRYEGHLPQWYRTTRELATEAMNAAIQLLPFLPQTRGLRITAAPYIRAGVGRTIPFIKPPAPTPRPIGGTVRAGSVAQPSSATPPRHAPPPREPAAAPAPTAPPRQTTVTLPGDNVPLYAHKRLGHLSPSNGTPASRPTQPAPPAPRPTQPAAHPTPKPTVTLPTGVVRSVRGGVDFANSPDLYPVKAGQRNIVRIQYTGSRRQDFGAANEAAGIGTTQKAPEGYTWHHLDDYDPATNTGTMQLVKTETHRATYPHNGGVAQFEAASGRKYKW